MGSFLEEVLVVIGEREDTTVALAWDEWRSWSITVFKLMHSQKIMFLVFIFLWLFITFVDVTMIVSELAPYA